MAAADTRDPAAAEALFEDARKAMDSGDLDTACAKFRESDRLDPAVGTTFNVANCEEKRGKLATAWELFRSVVERMPPGDARLPTAKARMQALAPKVPRLTIQLASGAPEGTTLRRGDVELTTASLGTALPVDPGKHQIVVSAPGHTERTYDLELKEGEKKTLDVAVGKPTSAAPPLAATDPAKAEPSSSNTDPTSDASFDSGSGDNRTLGYVIGGAGALGVLVGSITGIMALSKKSTVSDHCNGDRFCDAQGSDAADSGSGLGTISTVGFLVGAVGLGVGGYFILTSDDKGSETAFRTNAGPGSLSLGLSHRW